MIRVLIVPFILKTSPRNTFAHIQFGKFVQNENQNHWKYSTSWRCMRAQFKMQKKNCFIHTEQSKLDLTKKKVITILISWKMQLKRKRSQYFFFEYTLTRCKPKKEHLFLPFVLVFFYFLKKTVRIGGNIQWLKRKGSKL